MNKFLQKNFDIIGVFSLMGVVFSLIMFSIQSESDLWAHAEIAQKMLVEGRLFETNFLMYFVANLLSGFSANIVAIRVTIVLLITCSVTAKYTLTRVILQEQVSATIARLGSLSLLFVYVIPVMYFLKIIGIFENTHNMYMQYFVPNVWHNSTILCCMPFAIASYYLSVKQFSEYNMQRNYWLSLWLGLSVLVKPSFFFVFAVSYPIIMLYKYQFTKQFWYSLLPILIGVLLMIYEYLTIYNNASDGSSVAIDFSVLWSIPFWKSKALYLLVSIAFPLLFLSMYAKEVYKDCEFWFAAIMLGASIGIYYVCHETGPRASHGNFYWQVVPSMWFVYYYILKIAVNQKLANTPPYANGKSFVRILSRENIILTLYALHVIIGLIYIIRFLITKDFG